MSKATPAILIFDVGKTNKKLLVFNSRYELLHSESVQFEEIRDEDDLPSDNIGMVTEWIKSSFQRVFNDARFEIRAVNFSGYGASFVCVDDQLNPILPLYNYLKPYPVGLRDLFYNRYGGASVFSKRTASPILGSLNSGMQLFRLKEEKPEMFKRVTFALHLPQYLSSILTHKGVSEITSVGCHTNLWDFEGNQYHDWVSKEGIDSKLAPMTAASECQVVRMDGTDVQVGPGLHDSSAALIPYLLCFNEPFILLSTGTWCISLNPFNHSPLTKEELEQDCLCYLTPEGAAVKASRLFAGHEHEQQVHRIADHFNLAVEYFTSLEYEPRIGKRWNQYSHEQQPVENNFTFRNKALADFSNAVDAYHTLMFDIVLRQIKSTGLVLKTGEGEVKQIFIDGGFSRNSIYMNLMALAFPKLTLYSAKVPEASALGAALVIHEHWNNGPLPPELIELKCFSTIKEPRMG